MHTAAVTLLAVLAAVVSAQQCTDAQPLGYTNLKQSVSCTVETPYCVYKGPIESQNTCARCGIGGTAGYGEAGGGSCACDARTSYCSQSGATAGSCVAYTLMNRTCATDADCRTQAYAITQIYPTMTTALVTDERLFCVLSKCKPCKPSDWTQYVGPLGTTRTCGGYDSALSNRLGRYAANTSQPAYTYTCSLGGDIVIVNATVDYNYQYPLGDRSLWAPSTTTTTSSSSTTRSVSAATTATMGFGGGTITSTTSANANSSATRTSVGLAVLCILSFMAHW